MNRYNVLINEWSACCQLVQLTARISRSSGWRYNMTSLHSDSASQVNIENY